MPKSISFGFDGPYHSPGFLLWRVSGAWQRTIRDALEGLGLTHAQFVFMATLAWYQDQDGMPLTQAQLAQTIAMDVMTASQLARSLEARGLLERPGKAGDARAKTLRLTKTGFEAIGAALPIVEAADARFFASLETPEGFTENLRKLIGAV